LLAAACARSPQPPKAGLAVAPILAASDEFVVRWNAAPIGVPPEIENLTHAPPDQPVYIACAVSGFALDERGFANLRVDLELVGPAGDPLLHQSGFAAYDRRPEPGRTTVLVSAGYALTLESSDVPGTYSVRLRVIDLVSGAVAEARAPLRLDA
jgi:hypothetical protein